MTYIEGPGDSEADGGDDVALAIVMPDGATEWQASVLWRIVRLCGGRLLHERQWLQEQGTVAAAGLTVLTLPSLAVDTGSLPPAGQPGAACVEVEVEHATAGSQIWLAVPPEATVSQLKRLIADRCGDDEEAVPRMRLLRRWSASTFLPLGNAQPIGGRRRFLAMGVNFAGVPPRVPLKAPVVTLPTPAEALGLLASALELLEDPGVGQSLATADRLAGGTLAAWKAPLTEQGCGDLEALAGVDGATLLGWADGLVGALDSLRAATAGLAG